MPRPLSDSTRVAAAEHVVTASAPGEAILLDPIASRYYSLDAVGERIWQLIQRPTTVAELREAIVTEYDVTEAVFDQHLRELLTTLDEAGLITLDDASPA